MPTLNPDKCYNLELGSSQAVAVNVPLPEDWLGQLAKMVKETLCLSLADLQKLELDFNKHAGPNATYSLKLDLQNKLQEIYFRFTAADEKKLPDSLKVSMATKLHEDVGQCTPGFHDRVYETLSGFYIPTSMDALLTQIRNTIVEVAARQTTDEVHAHNRFAMVAAADGYGVTVLHPNDAYSGAIPDIAIREKIQLAFKNNYHALNILNRLCDDIKGVLHTQYEYTGAHLPEDEYTFVEFGKFLDYLEKIFGDYLLHEDITERSDYLLLNKESNVIDLNWKKIKQTLFYMLAHARYIDFSENERKCIKGLLDDNHEQACDLKFLYSDGFITNASGLSNLLYLLSNASFLTKQRLVINHLLHVSTIIDQEFLQIINTLKHEPDLLDAIKLFITDRGYLEDQFSQDEYGFSPFLRAIRNKENMSFLLGCFSLLTNEKQVEILTQNLDYTFTPLLVILYSHPVAFKSIIQMISSWSVEQQELLFTFRDATGNAVNILMHSPYTNIHDYKLIIKAIKSWPPEKQVQLLNQKNIQGQNVLMIALYHPKALQLLLEMISQLPALQQTEILTQSYNDYPNLLIYAIYACFGDDQSGFTQLLKLVSKLPPENQIQLFKQSDSTQKTLLMHVLGEPETLTAVLDVIANFTMAQQVDIFSQLDTSDTNFFMLAIKYSKISSLVLERISEINTNELEKIFTQIDTCDDNLLMLALVHQAPEVPALLKKIQRLSPGAQDQILFQTDTFGENILMLAANYQPLMLPSILKLIERNLKLNHSSRISNLFGGNGYYLLMKAVATLPETVPPFLNLMNYLSLPEQLNVLMRTKEGLNVFMIAVSRQPKSVPSLLKFLLKLPIDEQLKILKQLDLNSDNLLMLAAATASPQVLASILKIINKLPEGQQIGFFIQRNNHDNNALMRAYEPESIRLILQSILVLDPELQKKTLPNQFNNVIEYAVIKHPETLHALLDVIEMNTDKMLNLSRVGGLDKLVTTHLNTEQKKTLLIIRLTLQLVALKHDIGALETLPDTYKVAMDLYTLLKKNLRAYKRDSNLPKLQSAWDAAINVARPLLHENEGLSETLNNFVAPFVPSIIQNFGFFSGLKRKTTARLEELQIAVRPLEATII